MSTKKNTPKIIDSTIEVRESKASAERAHADLNIPDPKPERAKAILEGLKEEEKEDGQQ